MVFSTFPHRESISLFARLKAEGFPCTELKEQHRMVGLRVNSKLFAKLMIIQNQCISRFIFENFYPEGMRNSPEMRIPLIKDEPVLFECLQQFIRDSSGKPALQLKGADLRTHYLQIKGVRKQEPDSGSSYVREHIQVFFNTIFWYLHAYYGKRMQENVMIIAAYGYAVSSRARTRCLFLTSASFVCGKMHQPLSNANTSFRLKTSHRCASSQSALRLIPVKGEKRTLFSSIARCKILTS